MDMRSLFVLAAVLVCVVSSASVVRMEQQDKKIQPCPNDAPKVDVTLYFESLCPGCFELINKNLTPAYNHIGYIMNLTLLPFGNAREKKKGDKYVYKCQHGPQECEGNFVETCALHYYPNMTQTINFIDCFEVDMNYHQPSPHWKESLQICADPHGVDEKKISTCVTGDEGWQLEHVVATQTGDHRYVPWVIINGKHEKDYDDHPIMSICEAYTGPKPDYCKKF